LAAEIRSRVKIGAIPRLLINVQGIFFLLLGLNFDQICIFKLSRGTFFNFLQFYSLLPFRKKEILQAKIWKKQGVQ